MILKILINITQQKCYYKPFQNHIALNGPTLIIRKKINPVVFFLFYFILPGSFFFELSFYIVFQCSRNPAICTLN